MPPKRSDPSHDQGAKRPLKWPVPRRSTDMLGPNPRNRSFRGPWLPSTWPHRGPFSRPARAACAACLAFSGAVGRAASRSMKERNAQCSDSPRCDRPSWRGSSPRAPSPGSPSVACAANAGDAFANPEPVAIIGYQGHAMEPFISRDARYLLFNNLNEPSENTDLEQHDRNADVRYERPMNGMLRLRSGSS
jgi:hypothetical protein